MAVAEQQQQQAVITERDVRALIERHLADSGIQALAQFASSRIQTGTGTINFAGSATADEKAVVHGMTKTPAVVFVQIGGVTPCRSYVRDLNDRQFVVGFEASGVLTAKRAFYWMAAA